MGRALALWTDLFVVWVLVFSAVAYACPGPFRAFSPAIVPALGVIMFGMGMTLLPEDFTRVAHMKLAVACGLTAQFVVMPLTAWLIATSFRLPPELAMGFIIVGSCPGGTASNVITYLAKADVALSVTMTALSTLLAVILTPWLIGVLGGRFLPVDPWGLLMSVVTIVLVPVLAGFGLRRLMPEDAQRRFLAVFPAISVLVISLVIASIVASARDRILEAAGVVGALVVLHNAAGLTLGYGFASVLRLPLPARRAIAIEVGMQNSGLGVALATAHFSNMLVALPSSVFSVVHNLTGSALAGYWGRNARDKRGSHDHQ